MQDGDISNQIAPAILINIKDTVIHRVSENVQAKGLIERIRGALGDYSAELSRWFIEPISMSVIDRISFDFEYRVILCTVGFPKRLHDLIENRLSDEEVAFSKMRWFDNILQVRDYVLRPHRRVILYFDANPDNVVVVNGKIARLFEGWSSLTDEL